MATAPAPAPPEDFWDDLLAFIEERRVIPIIGAELLVFERDGVSIPLYRAVAERLLSRYGLSPDDVACRGQPLRQHFELNDAVCALAADGRRVRDLYRPVHDILQSLLAEHSELPATLRELASIRHFDLFVSATPDDLLARALNAVRYDGKPQTDQIEYAPKLPTHRRRDIPVSITPDYTAVFYLFGQADVAPFYAIHDEDALEFPYVLQAGGGPERMFSQLRTRNLLLIGCTFADWLSRLFLRLSNSERLFSDQRTKKEFLVGEETAKDRNLTVFLERFSQDTRCCHVEARAFVAELYTRWCQRNPPRPESIGSAAQFQAPAGHTIFLSYAREDIEAARRLYQELQAIGGDVAWFDKNNIMPGDEWRPLTLAALKKCKLFLPLISANTELRNEGEFRREWREAEDRAKYFEGRNFIMPIVLDEDYRGDAKVYELVRPSFRDFHYGHAPGGRMSDQVKAEIQEQLRVLRRSRAS